MNDDELSDSELGVIRASLRAHFDRERLAAPSAPDRIRRLARIHGATVRHRVGLGLATTCLVALVLFLAFSLRPRADASPAAVLGRAAANYLALSDATLRVEVGSDALAFLGAMLATDDESPKIDALAGTFFVDIAKPDRFLIRVATASGPGVAIAGCDGKELWTFDPATRRAHALDLGEGADPPEFDLTRWLSFEFVRRIDEERGRGTIVEVTTTDPETRRRGRRTFTVEPSADSGSDSPVRWSRATLVVDPAIDAIVEARVALRIGPLEVAQAGFVVLTTDSGFGREHFSVGPNVPADVRVVRVAVRGSATTVAPSPSIEEWMEDEPPAIVLARTGLRFAEFESVLRRNMISTSTAYGLKVSAVAPDSPAHAAGIVPGDLLMKWEGKPVRSTRDLASWLTDPNAPKSVSIEIARRKRTSLLSRKPWTDLSMTLTPLHAPR